MQGEVKNKQIRLYELDSLIKGLDRVKFFWTFCQKIVLCDLCSTDGKKFLHTFQLSYYMKLTKVADSHCSVACHATSWATCISCGECGMESLLTSQSDFCWHSAVTHMEDADGVLGSSLWPVQHWLLHVLGAWTRRWDISHTLVSPLFLCQCILKTNT